ncbi:hypothetical protein JI742_00480 [Piscinibacter sp. Jin2]|uniref:Uncharacterized protein n=1 Tax=Aquariibacter lacus TaxID=2801332 RepID=A0A9X1BQ29_9BURK|nr:hypothetical protein [Piscinibacter lacus]MBL0718354.1 hypothetical protein [Piscinibacter lacus]
MIHESRHWKEPLLRAATWLSKLCVEEGDAGERSLVRVERELFIGFYAIRKLLETFKVSPSTKELKLALQAYTALPDRKVDYFNRADIDKFFNLSHPMNEHRNIGFICNQIVHSYIFIIDLREDGALNGFFVTPDSMRFKKLYFIELGQVVHALRLVGKDYPRNMQYQRNPKTGQWEVHEQLV